MAMHKHHSNRNSSGVYLLESTLSGFLFGLSPLALKIASAEMYLSLYSLVGALLGLIGFLLMQRAIYRDNVSTAVSLINSVTILTTFLFTILIFNEHISAMKWIGAAMIIAGTVLLLNQKR